MRGDKKDIEYQKRRNKLIPFAAKFANDKCGSEVTGNKDIWIKWWNTTFLGEMDRLAREQKLIGG